MTRSELDTVIARVGGMMQLTDMLPFLTPQQKFPANNTRDTMVDRRTIRLIHPRGK